MSSEQIQYLSVSPEDVDEFAGSSKNFDLLKAAYPDVDARMLVEILKGAQKVHFERLARLQSDQET